MPIDRAEIISLCTQLAEIEDMRVSVTGSAKGAAIVGASAFTGGLLAGPVGLAAGGILSSLFTLAAQKNNYKPVWRVLREDTTPNQRIRLAESVGKIITNFRVEDTIALLPLVLANGTLKDVIIKEILFFLQNELHMKLIQ